MLADLWNFVGCPGQSAGSSCTSVGFASGSDGTFLLCQFALSYAQPSGGRIVLVCCHKSFAQHRAVLARMGVNCSRLADEGRLEVVDVATAVGQSVAERVENGRGAEDVQKFADGLCKGTTSLRPLLDLICLRLSKRVAVGSTLVVVDNITLFLDLGVQLADLVWFTVNLKMAVQGIPRVSLLIGLELGVNETDHQGVFGSFDLQFLVKRLPTGDSRDVQGQMDLISWKGSNQLVPESLRFLFSLKTKSVQYRLVSSLSLA